MRVLCNVRRTDRYLLASRVILCSVKSSPSRRKNPSSCSLISGWKIYERIQRREKEKERKERKKGKGRRERSVRCSDDKTCPRLIFPIFDCFSSRNLSVSGEAERFLGLCTWFMPLRTEDTRHAPCGVVGENKNLCGNYTWQGKNLSCFEFMRDSILCHFTRNFTRKPKNDDEVYEVDLSRMEN